MSCCEYDTMKRYFKTFDGRNYYCKKARVFASVRDLHPSPIFAGKAGAYQSGVPVGNPANIRLGWKSLTLTNTLAYYDTAIITAGKKFYITNRRSSKGLGLRLSLIQIFQRSLQWMAEIFLESAKLLVPVLQNSKIEQGILKGEVSLYHWPPVWLVLNQLYDNWRFLFICKTD